MSHAEPRHDWTLAEVEALFELPFAELVFRAAEVHRHWFDPAEVQLSQLLSVKTGGCPEDCGYCAQSQKFDTGVSASKLLDAKTVIDAARLARDGGAQRFCMGAAWRDLKDRDLPKVAAMISGVKALGLFHHDPSHDDSVMDGIEREARALFLPTFATREGTTVSLG